MEDIFGGAYEEATKPKNTIDDIYGNSYKPAVNSTAQGHVLLNNPQVAMLLSNPQAVNVLSNPHVLNFLCQPNALNVLYTAASQYTMGGNPSVTTSFPTQTQPVQKVESKESQLFKDLYEKGTKVAV